MTFKTLSYFCEACKDLQFSKTVQRLYITPQSLSQAIRSLEDELKCHLFLRTAAGLQLTAEGVYLREHAGDILSSLQEIHDTLSNKPVDQAICINLLTGVSAILSASLPYAFQKHTIAYRELPASTCIENVLLRRATAAIGISAPQGVLNCRPLWSSPLCAVISVNHPLAQANHLTAEQFHEQSLIVADSYRDLNDDIISQFTERGISFRERISASTPFDTLNLCGRNQGIALFPQCYLAQFRMVRPDIRIIPMRSKVLLNLYFITSKDANTSDTDAIYSFLYACLHEAPKPEILHEI